MAGEKGIEQVWQRYVDARNDCRQLDGTRLLRAQDQEADAFFALARIRSRCLAELELKIEALEDALSCLTGWADEREAVMLRSIRQDLNRMADG